MSKPDNSLISLIIPVYNISRYLERCMNSIIQQSYKNIEIILIDDDSTDNSVQICDVICSKYLHHLLSLNSAIFENYHL